MKLIEYHLTLFRSIIIVHCNNMLYNEVINVFWSFISFLRNRSFIVNLNSFRFLSFQDIKKQHVLSGRYKNSISCYLELLVLYCLFFFLTFSFIFCCQLTILNLFAPEVEFQVDTLTSMSLLGIRKKDQEIILIQLPPIYN